MKLTELFTSIANTIRNRNPYADPKIKAVNFPYEIDRACNESEMIGYNYGLDEGRQTEYDTFWDAFQKESTDYSSYQLMFAGKGWKDSTFKPKNNIVVKDSAYGMFWNSDIVDLKGILERQHVTLDLSKATVAQMTFFNCYYIERVGVLDVSNVNHIGNMFGNCRNLTDIDEFVVSDKITEATNAFVACRSLANITMKGSIGTDISFAQSPLLTTASLLSILTTLSKDSAYASGKTLTLNTASKTVVEADSDCSEQLAQAVSAGWTIAYA